MLEMHSEIWLPKLLADEVSGAVRLVPGITRTEIVNPRDLSIMTSVVFYFDADVISQAEIVDRISCLLQTLDIRRRTVNIITAAVGARRGTGNER